VTWYIRMIVTFLRIPEGYICNCSNFWFLSSSILYFEKEFMITFFICHQYLIEIIFKKQQIPWNSCFLWKIFMEMQLNFLNFIDYYKKITNKRLFCLFMKIIATSYTIIIRKVFWNTTDVVFLHRSLLHCRRLKKFFSIQQKIFFNLFINFSHNHVFNGFIFLL
jgi:hypothetical protein